MQFIDTVAVAGTRRTEDGYLVADAKVARTGIQLYLGAEVGRPDMRTVRVYRPADAVFDRASLASYAHKPMASDHPGDGITADNWKRVAVGHLGEEVVRDGEFVRVPLIVMDRAAVADIEAGKRELSAGYTCELDFTGGQTPEGEAYDAIQKNIRINHVAIVHRGRAGAEARIGDGAVLWGTAPIAVPAPSGTTPILDPADERQSHMADTLRKILIDGHAVETTDAGAEAIDRLIRDKTELTEKLGQSDQALEEARQEISDATAVLDARDEEIGKLKAELANARDGAAAPADLDARVAARVALITAARMILADLQPDGLSDAEIRRHVVTTRMGEAAIEAASDAEIGGMFKALVRDAEPADPMRAAMLTRDGQSVAHHDGPGRAYARMVEDMQKAHQPLQHHTVA